MSKINLIAPINRLSYGYVSQNIIKALITHNVEVSLQAIGPVEPDTDCGYDKYIEKCSQTPFPNTPTLAIWHQFDLKRFAAQKPFIGFPIFELDTLNTLEIDQINSCDHIIVCSSWAKDVIAKYSA